MNKNKEKTKTGKRKIITRIFALGLVLLTLLASCSTCIYYVVLNIKG